MGRPKGPPPVMSTNPFMQSFDTTATTDQHFGVFQSRWVDDPKNVRHQLPSEIYKAQLWIATCNLKIFRPQRP